MKHSTHYLLISMLLWAASGCARTTGERNRPEGSPPATDMQGAEKATPAEPVPDPTAIPGEREVAILAGGCFWGMEELLRKIDGVIDTEVGYTGGKVDNPRYEDLTTGTSGHAESVRVVFDPRRLSYDDLLAKWFFRMHDPTTLNRQGNDIGSQYRSAIFYLTPEQKRVAETVKKRVDASGKWKKPIVTAITPAGRFTPAEKYHQDYLQKNPDGYTCHFVRDGISF